MSNSVFAQVSFWAMVGVSLVLPCVIYGVLLARRSVSRWSVLVLGIVLVGIAGVDVWVLRHLAALASATLSPMDDAVFGPEVSFALYLFPLMFGGVGVNLISHVLISHLVAAERRFEREHAE